MKHATLPPQLAATATELRNAFTALPAGAEFSDDDLESFYASAYESAQAGRNQEALELATFAAVFRPSEPRYLHAVAVLLCKVDRHEHALTVFRILDTLEPCTPRNVLGMAECALGMKQPDKAVDYVEQLIEHCERYDKTGPELEKARAIHKLLTGKERHVH